MQREEILDKLRTDGFAVIPNVLPDKECDEFAKSYKRWYQMMREHTPKMKQRHSVIQSYRIGQFNNSWKIRLQAKPVFEMLWGTEKLLTSVDGLAISQPPETGDADFRSEGDCWLHLDQSVRRVGHHAYQGAVYLEGTTEEDYCFRVLRGSNRFHQEFFQNNPKAAEKSQRGGDHQRLQDEEIAWYKSQGCTLTYVPVPKGGMVLWDSRTAHDNIAPLVGRKNTDRWRCVAFVSMTPAFWAGPNDLEFKQKVYGEIAMTSHWSSQGQKRFKHEEKCDDFLSIKKLPAIAKTQEVKLLMGVSPYNFNDGQPNGPPPPIWQ